MPAISVICPIYNVEKYIERCARSLFEQTLDDIEYIFIDDCSPDKSVEIIESVLKDYPHRIPKTQIVRLQKNAGTANARKKGIALATGEYIANCDSDDWIDLNMYKLMYDEAVANDYDIVRCLFARCFETYNEKCYLIPSEVYAKKEKVQSFQLMGYDFNSLCDKIIRRKIFTENDFVYPISHMYEDNVIVTQAIYYSKKIGYIDNVLYYYYQNPDSICKGVDPTKILKRLDQEQINIDLIIQFLEDKNIASQYSREILVLKYSVREELHPIINEHKYWKMWCNTYPEITLFNLLGLKRKVSYILVCLRLYTPVRNFYRKYIKKLKPNSL